MDLLTNPFRTLGATMGDNRRRIMALAEEKSLTSDEASEVMVRDAKAVLIHPRRRLAAEIGWLPGLAPQPMVEALATLQQEPANLRGLVELPSLTRANLLAAGLVDVVRQLPTDDVAQWILELSHVHEAIAAEPTMALLNKERSAAGFPALTDLQAVDDQLRSQRQYYGKAIKKALNLLLSRALVEVVATTVNEATHHGKQQAPILIDDLVDGFEVEAQEFFERETRTIKDLLQRIRRAAERDEGYQPVSRLASQLEGVVQNWDQVAQPIQMSAQSRGTDHDLSHEIVRNIRNLAFDLFNDHGFLAIPWKLTVLQQEVFAEIASIVEQAEEDVTAFHESAQRSYKRLA